MTVAHVARRPGLLERRCPDRVLVLADDEVHTLTGPAADLWLALEAVSSIEALAERLRESLGQPVSADDVLAVVDVLIGARLVTPSSSLP